MQTAVFLELADANIFFFFYSCIFFNVSSVSNQPAYVKRENVLWQQLGSHGRVKHWGDISY